MALWGFLKVIVGKPFFYPEKALFLTNLLENLQVGRCLSLFPLFDLQVPATHHLAGCRTSCLSWISPRFVPECKRELEKKEEEEEEEEEEKVPLILSQ